MTESPRDRWLVLAEQEFLESIEAKQKVVGAGMTAIVEMAEMVVQAFRGHHRLYLFGNGGSAADAQHLAAELVNRLRRDRAPLPALALTVDTSVLTSIGNDYRFDDIFLRQLQALAQPGDVALGISTSGSSPNVVKALRWAREHGVHTVGWAGAAASEMDVYCDIILHMPSQVTARVQECHITVGHVFCLLVEEMLFGDPETVA